MIEAYIQDIKCEEMLLTLVINTLKFYFRHETRAKGTKKGTEKQSWLFKLGFEIRKDNVRRAFMSQLLLPATDIS